MPRWFVGAVIFVTVLTLWILCAGAVNTFILVMFSAVLFAAAMRPLIARLSTRMPYGAAVGVAFAGVIVLAGLITLVLVAPLGSEVVKFVRALPATIASLQERLLAARSFIKSNEVAAQLVSAISKNAGSAISVVSARLLGGSAFAIGLFGDIGLVVLMAIAWASSSDQLTAFVLDLIPAPAREAWKETLAAIESQLRAYVYSVLLNGGVVGVVMASALLLMGVPYAFLLGFIAAIMQGVPMVGTIISGGVILVVVFATNGWEKTLAALAVLTVVQIVDQNVVSPRIFGKHMQLSFLLVLVATFLGGMLLGIDGAFLAVPAAVALQIVVVRIVAPAIRRANARRQDGAA